MDFRLLGPALGCWGITIVGLLASRVVTVSIVLVAVASSLIAVVLAVRDPRYWRLVAGIIATAGVVAAVGAILLLRLVVAQGHPIHTDVGHRTSVELAVRDDPQWLSPNGSRMIVKVSVIGVGQGPDGQVRKSRAGNAVVFVTGPLRPAWAPVSPGQHVRAVVGVRPPRGDDLSVAMLSAASPPTLTRSAPWYFATSSMVRHRFSTLAQRGLSPERAGLLPGLVLGDTAAIDDQVRDDFRRSGLSHLLAVSGANFALVVGVAVLGLRLGGAGPRATAVLGVVVIVGFVILVRPSPSVVRAAGMGLIALLALARSRRTNSMAALCVAIGAAVVWWPDMALDAGFAMSVAATAALVCWGADLAFWLHCHRIPHVVAQLVAITFIAQVVTAPLVAMISGQFSITGLLANIVVVPVVGVITVIGVIAAFSASLGGPAQLLAELLIRLLGPALGWMLGSARLLGRQDWATVGVPDGVAGALLLAGLVAVGVSVVRVWQHGSRGGPLTFAARRRRLPDRSRDQRGRGRGQRAGGRERAGHADPGGRSHRT